MGGKALAQEYGVRSMPTILFFRDCEEYDRVVGADKAALQALVARATMSPLLRLLSGNAMVVAALSVYLTVPWAYERLQRAKA